MTFVLENYTLTTFTAEVLETREKRIYAPSFMKLTEEIKKESDEKMGKKTEKTNEIILFENQNVKLEVNMKDETVWLTQEQMSKLFDKDRTVITRHISNIFKDGELEEKGNANRMDTELKGNEAREIIKVINNYSSALNLLDDYDHKKIVKPEGVISNKMITYEDCKKIIQELKFNHDSNLFALERNDGLKAILGSIYQSFDGKDLYPTIQEKGSNFLYLLVKNHVFIDGNKRIAATLFIYFLQYYDILMKENHQVIDNSTLVAITLLIAESNPHEKQILIDLIMNFLQ